MEREAQVQMLHSDYSPLENGYEYETIKKIKMGLKEKSIKKKVPGTYIMITGKNMNSFLSQPFIFQKVGYCI